MEFDINNDRYMIMSLMSANGITPEEYAEFCNKFKDVDFRKILSGDNEEDDFDISPIDDADEKTLKLKIQLRDVNKPPMWREVLVPADFNFSQLHYVIQAVTGLNNCHLWQFEYKPYDHGGIAIGIPKEDEFSFGIEDCTHEADQTPVTAFLAQKGDKLVYVYDFRIDWIFNITVLDVLERQGEVAECTKYKSELQALDNIPPYLYTILRNFHTDPQSISKEEYTELTSRLWCKNKHELEALIDDNLIDLEFVNEELSEIPDNWEPID